MRPFNYSRADSPPRPPHKLHKLKVRGLSLAAPTCST